ncbi:MAG TPA: surface-adhesin E family protein [Burkholderiales bacterium]|nr:surface-adhesin E family protein [Burkholderiales bacterium]
MIKKIVGNFFLVLAVATGAANAADWEVLNAQPEEAMLLDENSIHHDGSVWKAWAVQSYKRTEYLGEPVYPHRSRVTLYEVDCKIGQLGYAAWSFQSGELGGGTTVWADTARGVMYFRPDADSSESALLERVCGAALAHDGDRLVSDSRPNAAQE